MIPLFISLFIMAYQAEANRYSMLAGSLNSLLYTAAYLYMGGYGSAASAFLFSFPIQLWTFFSWQKRSYKKTVVFKKMSSKARGIMIIAFIAIWASMAIVFTKMNYTYAILDSVSFILGFISPALRALAYVEYTYLDAFGIITGLLLTVQVTVNDIGQMTYLIYGIYTSYLSIVTFINVRKFYKEQNEVKNE